MAKIIELPVAAHKINDAAIRQLPKHRRRWNRRRAWDNLLTLAGLVGFGVIVYMMFCELTGR